MQKKRLTDKLVEKQDEGIDEIKMIHNVTLYYYRKVWRSRTVHIVLLIIASIILMSICGACIYVYCMPIKNCFNKLSY